MSERHIGDVCVVVVVLGACSHTMMVIGDRMGLLRGVGASWFCKRNERHERSVQSSPGGGQLVVRGYSLGDRVLPSRAFSTLSCQATWPGRVRSASALRSGERLFTTMVCGCVFLIAASLSRSIRPVCPNVCVCSRSWLRPSVWWRPHSHRFASPSLHTRGPSGDDA